ncbi:MAG: hypothetical protein KAS32_15205 [Candidatus Peribacteraceae bacterium]|nr:hypothetical protein [Candidatus Peribacteraceae bacterium]
MKRCPRCNWPDKDPSKVKGGQKSKRKLTKKDQKKMLEARNKKKYLQVSP